MVHQFISCCFANEDNLKPPTFKTKTVTLISLFSNTYATTFTFIQSQLLFSFHRISALISNGHLLLSRPAAARHFQDPAMSSSSLSNYYLPFELGVQGRVKQMSVVSVMIICKSVVTRPTPQWRGRMRIAALERV